jgi:hypothetical protein
MSKRLRDEDEGAASVSDATKRARYEEPACGRWDDLIDDTKALVRRACPKYVQRLLGMTCKAEYAVKTRPQASPSTLLHDLLRANRPKLAMMVADRHRVETFHEHILHPLMRRGKQNTISTVFERYTRLDMDGGRYEISPCCICFRIVYTTPNIRSMDAFLVDLVIDDTLPDAYDGDDISEIRDILKDHADDHLLAKFVRHF